MQALLDLDAAWFRWAYDLGIPQALALPITHLGSGGALWLLAAVGLVAFGGTGDRRTGLALGAGLLAHLLIAEVALKHLIARPRPCAALGVVLHDELVDAASYSFPSGHSAASFLGAWVLGARFPRARVPLLLLALLIATSRVVVGAHYPGDVTAGAMLGLGLGWLAVRLAHVHPRQVPTD